MLLDTYQQAAFDLLYKARTTQREKVIAVGTFMADAIEKGAKVYLGEICHSVQSDLLGRGGGPAFYLQYEQGKSELKPGDILVLSSVSGRTKSVVDLAWDSMQKGIHVIAFTSMSYAQAVDPVHESGKKLYEFVTFYVDNCAPAAEAMLEVEGLEPRFAAASGLASDFLMWSITSVCVEKMIADGFVPSVYKSAKYPGGNDYNKVNVHERYAKLGY